MWFIGLTALASAQPTSQQRAAADSIRQLVEQSSGISRATHLSELGKAYLSINKDSAKVFLNQSLAICRQQKNDTTFLKLVASWQYPLCRVGEKDLARSYLIEGRDLQSPESKTSKYRVKLLDALYNVHFWYFTLYDSAIFYELQANSLLTDSVALANSNLKIAGAYSDMGDNLNTLGYINRAQDYLTPGNEDPWTQAYLYNQLGRLYSDEKDLKKADEYFKKSVAASRATGVPGTELSALVNLGVLCEWLGEYDRALKYLDSVEILLPIDNDPWARANNMLNRGSVLASAGRYREGIAKSREAMAAFAVLKDDYTVAWIHSGLAQPYRMLGDYKTAEQEALIALEWDRKYGYGELVQATYNELSKIYAATGRYEKAFDYQTKYLKIIDSLNSAEHRTQFGLMEKNYEIAQAEKRQEQLERENEIHQAQAKANQTTFIALIAGAAVLSIAVMIVLYAYRTVRKQNEQLSLQNKKIEEQTQQLQEAAKTKARFFANVSHELRTPVTLLNGMLELMQEQPHRNGTNEKLEIALGSSRRLQGMLNEVLDLSRVEAGRWELSRKSQRLFPLLNRIVLAFESLMLKKNLRLEYDAHAITDVVVDIDEDKFEKVINNLVYNAIKFNRPGGWIKVSADRTEDAVVIQVADSGIGISEKDLPFVFDRFYQSASTTKLNAQGIGIGLSLVREFTELHGGQVHVNSVIHEGSCFTVQIPITSIEPATEEAEFDSVLADVTFQNLSKRPQLLIVEDNDDMRFYLKEILGDHVSIAEARHGREGLQWLKSHTPDLIISDVMMPEMDGHEFMSHLKGSATLRGIPVVMLTARASEEDLLQGLSLGVDDYIIKPFNAKELKIRIHNLLINQEIRKEWTHKPAEPGEEVIPPSQGEDKIFMEKVKAFVEENAGNAALGIADLGDHLAMSERQVYRKAATLTGMTPAQLIKEIRMKIAYRLLLERKVTKVADLARRVGFENTSYFSRQFQERFGKRPAEFL